MSTPEQLNPNAHADVARMRDMVAEAIDNSGESVHEFVSLPDLYQLLDRLAVAQPEVAYEPDAEALRKAVEAVHNETYGNHGDLAHIAVNAYVHARAADQPGMASAEKLTTTRAGLALANAAFKEGMSAGIKACNEAREGEPFVKPVSPYSAPLLALIKANQPDKEGIKK